MFSDKQWVFILPWIWPEWCNNFTPMRSILHPCLPYYSNAFVLPQCLQQYCWISSGRYFFYFRLICPGLMIPFLTINLWKWFRGSWSLRRELCTAYGAMLWLWSPQVEKPRGSIGDMYDFLIASVCCCEHILVQGKFFPLWLFFHNLNWLST